MSYFKIPAIPSTVHKSIRFSIDIVEDIEEAIREKMYFATFVVAVVRSVLEGQNFIDN